MLSHESGGASSLPSRGADDTDNLAGRNCDLGLAVSDHMHMGRCMVVEIDDDAQPIGAQYGWHVNNTDGRL